MREEVFSGIIIEVFILGHSINNVDFLTLLFILDTEGEQYFSECKIYSISL